MKDNKLLFEKLTKWATNRLDESVSVKVSSSMEEGSCSDHGNMEEEWTPEVGLNEDDLEEAPNKGKAVEKTVDGKKRSVGQAGKTPAPGTSKGDAYCARSAKIKKCKNPPCANDISRRRWKCRGSKSMKQE